MKYLITLALVMALITTGCSSYNENENTSTPPSNEETNNSNETKDSDQDNSDQTMDVSYEIMTFDALSDPIKNTVTYLKENAGYEILESSDEVFLFIGAGMQPTGGYALDIKSLTSKDDTITAEVNFIKPEPGAMVTQALTYPYIIVKLDKMYENIIILSDINFPAYVYHISSGTGQYVGQIDSSSIEVELSDGFIVLRSYYMENLLEGLHENDPIVFKYIALETKQNALINLNKTK